MTKFWGYGYNNLCYKMFFFNTDEIIILYYQSASTVPFFLCTGIILCVTMPGHSLLLLSLLIPFSSSLSTMNTRWFQHEISITAPARGCHLITNEINKATSGELSQIQIGMCNLFIQHTSASLTINENADPDVRRCVSDS